MVAHINRNYILVGLIFGIASGALWSSMPTLNWVMPIVVLFLVLFFTKDAFVAKNNYCKTFSYLAQGLLLGCFIMIIHGNHYRHVTETLFSQGNSVTTQAKVISFVQSAVHGQQMLLSIQRINNIDLPIYARPTVKAFFALPEENQPQLGEYWQFQIQVKPIIGQLNDAGFDSEQYYVSNQWHGKAVIEPEDSLNFRIKTSHSWRLWLYDKATSYLSGFDSKAFIIALAFGDRGLISDQQWHQLRDSGLSHLIAISGLHIGLAMAIGWSVGCAIKSLICGITHSSYSVFRFIPLIISFAVALFYAYLAGFALPTQRALIMGSLVLFMLASGIHWSVWQVLLYSLSLILASQPMSILQVSFWLSFGAIVIIYLSLWFYLSQHQRTKFNWRQVVIIQLGLFIGLAFLSIAFFGGISWISPVVNLVVIPWVSFIVVPVIFLCLILTAIFHQGWLINDTGLINDSWLAQIWRLADLTLQPILWLLQLVEGAWLALSNYWSLVSVLFAFALIAWRFRFYSTLYITALVVLLWQFFPARPKPEWQVQVLDVGQGLAVLIRKDQQSVLYDTGISWQGGSIANSIIVPLLHKSGEHQLSGLLISHTDLDHAGGRADIESTLFPQWKRSSEYIEGYQPCIKGQKWQWQQLNFDVVWPPKQVKRAYNPHSCVVQVSDGQFNLLLTGDVDAISEIILIRDSQLSDVDVMTVPHHGSATSSFPSFVESIKPSVAIASLALNNQWGLPSQDVKRRYQQNAIQWMDTAYGGQITISIYTNGWLIEQKRINQYQPWYRQIVRKGLE
ncbi:DNA internalization-related competence protein ComEC/Rec2 [Vibrio algivorus]|uniref:DNA internalization-related competence protein ComEC/Rec2 n=1 Tax=Vibrio algivorus TaxID=1667024 RepID=A0ABQ6EMB5_9VIBR|nr:DNA internalization-related competence protein ComEC/Rec2 [Vibrio algivorus]